MNLVFKMLFLRRTLITIFEFSVIYLILYVDKPVGIYV